MHGLEKINARIVQEGRDKADAVLAQAQQQCDEIRQRWEGEAKQVYETRLNAGKQEIQAEVDSAERIARLDAKKELLQLKQDMVSQGFDKAREALSQLPEDKYCALLTKLAVRSASGGEELVFNARDKAAVGAKVAEAANRELTAQGKPAGLTVSDEEGAFSGGLILRRGSVEINCTTELLVEVCRGELAAKMAGVLFD